MHKYFASRHFRHCSYDLMIAVSAIISAFFFTALIFNSLNAKFRWFDDQGSAKSAIHSAAQPEKEITTTQDAASAAIITVEKHFNTSSEAGAESSVLFNFTVTAPQDLTLKKLIFTLNDLSKPDELISLQLFQNKKMIDEVPYFEGQGIFQNLNLKLLPNAFTRLEVKGKVSDTAKAGDRLKLMLKDADAVGIMDSGNEPVPVKSFFPLWSHAVSIIGTRLK